MQQSLDLCQTLPVFLNQWRAYSRFALLENKLPAFFDELKEVLPTATVHSPPCPDPGKRLDSFYPPQLYHSGLKDNQISGEHDN